MLGRYPLLGLSAAMAVLLLAVMRVGDLVRAPRFCSSTPVWWCCCCWGAARKSACCLLAVGEPARDPDLACFQDWRLAARSGWRPPAVLLSHWRPSAAKRLLGESAPTRVVVLGLMAMLLASGVPLGREARTGMSAAPVRSKDARPNVLVVVMDTSRADHLSV